MEKGGGGTTDFSTQNSDLFLNSASGGKEKNKTG